MTEYEEAFEGRTAIILPYPISTNRYWRTFRNRVVRSKEADEYKRITAHTAFVAGWRVLDCPVAVSLCLHPKATKAGRASRVRMDLDNCIKVALDALNGIAYCDDMQVIRLRAEIGGPLAGGGLAVAVEAAR
jgi:crossover junction endodeoxyribonuclease RusA